MPESKDSRPSPSDTSSNSTSEPKKRGRPKGSKTQQVEHVIELPPGCPACNSTEYSVLQTPKQRDHIGKLNGQQYNRVTWRRCKCDRCGQIVMRRTYRLV